MSYSKYIGTPEKYQKFIIEWQKKLGKNLSINNEFKFNEFISNFPEKNIPLDCIHFFAAMESLGWPKIFKIFGEDFNDYSTFDFINEKSIEKLIDHDPDYVHSAGGESQEVKFEPDYSRNQIGVVDISVLKISYVIAEKKDVVFKNYLLVNGIIEGGGAFYDDANIPLSLVFYSFTEMVCWFYLTDLNIYEDQDIMPWLDSENDETGLSKMLLM